MPRAKGPHSPKARTPRPKPGHVYRGRPNLDAAMVYSGGMSAPQRQKLASAAKLDIRQAFTYETWYAYTAAQKREAKLPIAEPYFARDGMGMARIEVVVWR